MSALRLPDALVVNGPQNPVHLALLASLFLLRELEVGTANLSAWTFDTSSEELTWLLPSSKSDHMALGVTRSWGCLCDLPGFTCPYHIALEHRDWLRGLPGPGLIYRVVQTLTGLPGGMICERCLPTERAIAMNLMDDLSGDE